MKPIFIFFFYCSFLLVSSVKAISQKENNNWFFGHKAAISFLTNIPSIIPNSAIDAPEGCSSISNSNGSLLFYTDGITVWNKQNQQMPNGYGLHGNLESTSSAIIVQQPLNDSLYYIFTIDAYGSTNGLQYSIINMKLNNGLGDVVKKNIQLINPVSEKIAIIKHANNRDYWIVSHLFDGSNNFIAYLLTPSGVDSKSIISSVGEIIYVDFHRNNVIGQMKASPAGNKIAAAFTRYNFTQLFDFDNNTGILSNPIKLYGFHNDDDIDFGGHGGMYGLEFSPDGKFLYTSSGFTGWYIGEQIPYDKLSQFISQFDISLPSAYYINNSRIKVLENPSTPTLLGQMQLGPDNKIYIARYNSKFLGVISKPNVYGTGCEASYDGLSISPDSSSYGLPNLLKIYSSVLPLSILNFTCNFKDGNAILNWQTISQYNISHFIIQRSANGFNFQDYGTIKAINNMSVIQNYSFVDNISTIDPLTSILYYRIKQVEMDGEINYSKIISLNFSSQIWSFNILDNPTKNILHLQLNNLQGKTSIIIFDITGKRLQSQYTNSIGNCLLDLTINSLSKGTYIVQVQSNGLIKMQKFIKD